MIKNKISLIVFATVIALSAFGTSAAQIQSVNVMEIHDRSESIILKNGDAQIKEVISMSASAYVSFKQRYPVLSMFTRIFKPTNMPTQIENLNFKLDEGNNQFTADYIMRGVAVNKGDYWEIKSSAAESGGKITLASQNDNVLVFSSSGSSEIGIKMITTLTLRLPRQARDIKFDEPAAKITYKMPAFSGRNIQFLILGILFFLLAIASYVCLAKNKETVKKPD